MLRANGHRYMQCIGRHILGSVMANPRPWLSGRDAFEFIHKEYIMAVQVVHFRRVAPLTHRYNGTAGFVSDNCVVAA